jgi:hypothetical protein
LHESRFDAIFCSLEAPILTSIILGWMLGCVFIIGESKEGKMARWSDAIMLQQYYHWKPQLSVPGVYEIGFVRNGEFAPRYVGSSSSSIYVRLKSHWNEYGSKSIAKYYEGRTRDLLYFHFIKSIDGIRIEQNLLERYGIGRDSGLYLWNRKYEGVV